MPFAAITPGAALNDCGCDTAVAPRRRMKRLVEAAGIEETQTGFAKPFARREHASDPAGVVHEL